MAVVTPAVVLSTLVPMAVPLSKKVTVPVGDASAVLPGLVTFTVAVKVTVCSSRDTFTEVDSVVEVLALATTWLIDGEAALTEKFASPL
jgi:hypothetical protein